MNLKNTHFLTVVTLFIFTITPGFSQRETASITGKVSGETVEVLIGSRVVSLDTAGSFNYNIALDHPTIFTLVALGQRYEIFVAPSMSVGFTIQPDSLTFSGDLIKENEHLLSDKKLNDNIDSYLKKNWYTLHVKKEAQYLASIDSLKNQYILSMQQKKLGIPFVEVNTAAMNYAFDRMILRYPANHNYFTGNNVALSEKLLQAFETQLDHPQFKYLESYQKFTRTLLDQKLRRGTTRDTTTYFGKVRLTSALNMIHRLFKHEELKEYWSLEYIKAHLEAYTWINGKEFLDDFIASCFDPDLLNEAKTLKRQALAERADHDIHVYKTVKGQILEAHLFKPEDFDAKKNYPALATFHGGGWISGNAGWAFNSAEHAAKNGMIGISVEYRLSNFADVTPREAMEDTRDLISWLRANATSLNIDPNQIIAKGLSAGGHLVSSISILQRGATTLPNALVLVSPALDTSDEYFKSLLNSEIKAADLSSVGNLKTGLKMPPTLILQGRTDNLTPTKYALEFKEKMDSLGYHCELEIYENVGHLFTPSHLDDTGFPKSDPEVSKQAFVRQDKFLRSLGFIP